MSDLSTHVHQMLDSIGVTPRGVQKSAIDKGLFEGKSIMVCSPTGSGKTLIGEMALLRSVVAGRKGLYLVPLRALGLQVWNVLRERYEPHGVKIGLSTGDYQNEGNELSDRDIIVTTYERADSLLRHGARWLLDVGTVVIDEIQNLGEVKRGARLESAIIRLKHLINDLQLIALSATVGAPDELSEWLECELVESDDRPVPLHCKVLSTSNKQKTVRELVMTTIQSNGQAIVFQRTRREAEVEAFRLAADVGRQLTGDEKTRLDSELESVENWGVSLPPELRTVLHDGTAFHHAGLGPRARGLVERLFQTGRVRVVCATTTLAAGMDLPAKTVVVTNVKAPQEHGQLLSANRLHQMLGRAGRPKYDKAGFGVVLTGSEGEAEEVEKRYFDQVEESGKVLLIPRYDRVRSVLDTPSAMTELLLVTLDVQGEASLEEIEDNLLNDSYLIHCAMRDTKSPMRLLNLGEASATAAIERHALPDSIRAAKQGSFGAVNVREKGETVIGAIVTDWDGSQYACRFSSRLSSDGFVEGPQCSCGRSLDVYGIMCPHLVMLGASAAKELGAVADYVIPLSLSESSPAGVLLKLGLVEGGAAGKLKPTKLGRLINRLYLSIPTAREMLALLPQTEDRASLLWLLRHLISIESGMSLGESFDQLIDALTSTHVPIAELAKTSGFHEGDINGLIETTTWLLHSIHAVGRLGGLLPVMTTAENMIQALDLAQSRGPTSNDNGGYEHNDSA